MSPGIELTPEMRAAIGSESEPVTWEVEKGEIIRFAQAIGDPNPVYSDEAAARKSRHGGIIAPPTFLHAYGAAPVDFEYPEGVGLDGG
ncbi:MAG: MaoC family dehydratase N-terminal domain-containing protein, partial [Chloroflexi bacterium]|nr:MaoC family dehydratase N-terminal domain-containing protein [Chloroflexota bacterium]